MPHDELTDPDKKWLDNLPRRMNLLFASAVVWLFFAVIMFVISSNLALPEASKVYYAGQAIVYLLLAMISLVLWFISRRFRKIIEKIL